MLSLEEIYDPAVVSERSLQASVMDYADIHIATGGREQTAYFGTKPGPYDDWIVEYSYSTALEDRGLEAERLAAIAARSTESQLLFGTDDHVMRAPGWAMDPRVHWYDMTSDPIGYAEERLNLIEELFDTGERQERPHGRVLPRAARRLCRDVGAVRPFHRGASASDRRGVHQPLRRRPTRRRNALRAGEPRDTGARHAGFSKPSV
ncbi:MAG: hypothetical protein CM1200mP36_00290 [Gammaproteobacteria bacterium]|nr:MAG: hypothetical protein CM1200mP36_00290 [Gammaproteobacteria bacterium]